MKMTVSSNLPASIGLSALLCMLPAAVSAQTQAQMQMQMQAQGESPETKISPIAMSANVPGLDVTNALVTRLATQTELSAKQLEMLGLVAGKQLDEAAIRKVYQAADDFPARRYVDLLDGIFGKPQDRAEARNWKTVAGIEPFIRDAVNFGGFNSERERELRDALAGAAVDGDGAAEVKTRATAYRLLSDARQASLKTARGYRLLVDLLKRELEGRVFVQNIGLVIEVRTGAKQPTLAPVSLITMECGPKPAAVPAPTLVFAQRKRECSDLGVCRIESFADINKGREYKAVFDNLQGNNGRTYLDGCMLNTKMLIDGTEINRMLPGKFTSHTAPATP